MDNEGRNYRLHVSGYTSGNTDWDYWAYHNGSEFSTRDRDNDRGGGSCSLLWKGGHWYKNCYHVNPTGLYKSSGIDSMNLGEGTKPAKEMTLKTREPLSKGDSRTGLIAFHIQLHLANLTSLTH